MTDAEFRKRVADTAREIAIRRATVLRAAGRTDGFSPGSMTAAIFDATEIETVLRDYLREPVAPVATSPAVPGSEYCETPGELERRAAGYGPECDGSVKP